MNLTLGPLLQLAPFIKTLLSIRLCLPRLPLAITKWKFPLFALLAIAFVTNEPSAELILKTLTGRAAEPRRVRIRINIDPPSTTATWLHNRLDGYATGRAPVLSRLRTHTTRRRWRRITRSALTSVELFKNLTLYSVERRVRLPVKGAASALFSDISLAGKCIGWRIAAPCGNAQHAAALTLYIITAFAMPIFYAASALRPFVFTRQESRLVLIATPRARHMLRAISRRLLAFLHKRFMIY